MEQVSFQGRIVFLGFGAIASGILQLVLNHFVKPDIAIVTRDRRPNPLVDKNNIPVHIDSLNKENYPTILAKYLRAGDFLVNLSVDVSSAEIMSWCRDHGVLYLDTSIEAWGDLYTDISLTPSQRSNYALRETILAKKKLWAGSKNTPTAISAHGANPGLVSHFVKKALLDIARDTGFETTPPTNKAGWARLAHDVGIKVIHVAERDTQRPTNQKDRFEFVNTWSIDGFYAEAVQPTELGWGSHEKFFPKDGHRHHFGCGAAIYLDQPGVMTRVRSWTPEDGPYHGFIIPHIESIAIADFLSTEVNGKLYRPTTHYAYHPCDAAVLSLHEMAGDNFRLQPKKRVIIDEVIDGMDELGVLLMGHKKNAYWYGSRLTIAQVRQVALNNNATTLQVTASAMAAMVWAVKNPLAGLCEPDDLPFDQILSTCLPYLGDMVGRYTDWNPLYERNSLFPEDLDPLDPWQFKNFRVS
ncbi:MAG: saccharopine dehydrogenase NADP-binding domain-containing protein [Alphaproteobacteria bacterium]|nr:saccharopine dehydrogenase NADP-binding domain-containing protein [Alphaproteobacteria bacterium]